MGDIYVKVTSNLAELELLLAKAEKQAAILEQTLDEIKRFKLAVGTEAYLPKQLF